MTKEPPPCEYCEGAGTVSVIIGHVTLEMAIDGGDRRLEGMDVWGFERCPECDGTGYAQEQETEDE